MTVIYGQLSVVSDNTRAKLMSEKILAWLLAAVLLNIAWIETQENKRMKAFPSKSLSDNRKSAIQNPKWMGIFAIAFTFVLGGALAQAQQPAKIARIGFLDVGTASGSAVLVEAFRQELSKLGWIEGKNHHHRVSICRDKALSAYLSLRRTWFDLRLI